MMKTHSAVLFVLLSLTCALSQERGLTNLVVAPSEVDPKSVRLVAVDSQQPDLVFNDEGPR